MKFKKNKKVKTIIEYIFVFTVVEIVTCVLVFSFFFKENRSFIWEGDGLQQHHTALVYYGTYLRQILHNLFIDHKFCVPAYDLRIGYGSDIL